MGPTYTTLGFSLVHSMQFIGNSFKYWPLFPYPLESLDTSLQHMDWDEEPLAFPQLMSVSHYQRLSKNLLQKA